MTTMKRWITAAAVSLAALLALTACGACPGQLPSLGVRPLGNHSHLYYFEYIEQGRYIRYCSTDRGHRRRDRRGSLLV